MYEMSFEDHQSGDEFKDLNNSLSKLEFDLEESIRSLILINLDKFLEILNGILFSEEMRKKLLKETNELINLLNNLKTFAEDEIICLSNGERSTVVLLKLPYKTKSKLITLLIKNQEALLLHSKLISSESKIKLAKINELLIKELYELKVGRLCNPKTSKKRILDENLSHPNNRSPVHKSNDKITNNDELKDNLESNYDLCLEMEELNSNDPTNCLTDSNFEEIESSTSSENLSRINHMSAHRYRIRIVVADENIIFTGSDDELIKIWDLDFELQAILTGHKGPITHLFIDDFNKILFSASSHNEIRIWNYKNLESIELVPFPMKYNAKIGPLETHLNEFVKNKGTLLVSTEDTIDFWNYDSQELEFNKKPNHQISLKKLNAYGFSARYIGEHLYFLILVADGIDIYRYRNFQSSSNPERMLIYYIKQNLEIKQISFLNNGLDFITIYENGGVTISLYEKNLTDQFNNLPHLNKIKIERQSAGFHLFGKEKIFQTNHNSCDLNQFQEDWRKLALEKRKEYESKAKRREIDNHRWSIKILEDPLMSSLGSSLCGWTKDDQYVISIHKENLVKIWQKKSNDFELKYSLKINFKVYFHVPHPIENIFVLAGFNEIILLDLETGKNIGYFYHEGKKFTDFSFMPDGLKMVSADQRGRLSLFELI